MDHYAFQALKERAYGGDAEAQYRLGRLYVDQEVVGEKSVVGQQEEGLSLIKSAALLGNSDAQSWMANGNRHADKRVLSGHSWMGRYIAKFARDRQGFVVGVFVGIAFAAIASVWVLPRYTVGGGSVPVRIDTWTGKAWVAQYYSDNGSRIWYWDAIQRAPKVISWQKLQNGASEK